MREQQFHENDEVILRGEAGAPPRIASPIVRVRAVGFLADIEMVMVDGDDRIHFASAVEMVRAAARAEERTQR